MNPKNDWPDFPRFMIAVPPNVGTIRSPEDGQEGLAVFWTRPAALRVARSKPETEVIEATPEMFVEAIKKANEMGIPWLYIGRELGRNVDFQKVPMTVAVGGYV